VAVLLSKAPDLRKRLFIDVLWNNGGRFNEILPLTKEDFVLDDPLTAALLSSPFMVLRSLKQRKLEEVARSLRRRLHDEGRAAGLAGNRGGNPGQPAAGGAAYRSGIRATLNRMVCDDRLDPRGAALRHKE